MTVATHADTTPSPPALLPTLDAATHASAEAHEAARALTDTVLACQHLPADVYQYAPHLSQAIHTMVAMSRAVTVAAGRATADPAPANLYALHQAAAELTAATAALRYQTGALAAAAGWYSTPTALPPTHVDPAMAQPPPARPP